MFSDCYFLFPTFHCEFEIFEDSEFFYLVREIGEAHTIELTMAAMSTFSSPALISGICEPPASFSNLLQLLAGLNKPTSGSICIQRYEDDGQPKSDSELLPTEKVGIVFQFPERFFVADNVLDEITFGWPRQKGSLQLKERLTSNLRRAFNWVGLDSIPLDKDPQLLSGGYKRRLALAIQLTDWKARADVAKLLRHLKKELSLLVLSHDLRELAALVDQSWRMETGGVLLAECPPV